MQVDHRIGPRAPQNLFLDVLRTYKRHPSSDSLKSFATADKRSKVQVIFGLSCFAASADDGLCNLVDYETDWLDK